MVLLREDGMTQPKIAELTGMSLSTVNRAHMAYDNGGVNALEAEADWRAAARKYDCWKRKRLFLVDLPKPRVLGTCLNVHELKIGLRKGDWPPDKQQHHL